MNYYNEIDPYCAQWLRNLIAANLIPEGHVDQRDIRDVTPNDLKPYTQCHFFAGLGGWPLALQLATISPDRPLWTGSCPCQPFSAAGARRGFADDRHLWPYWFYLIQQCRPPIVLGEQVEAVIRQHWLDTVFVDLEGEGYACGAAVLPACGVGAPHIRQRLWFVAHADQGRGGRHTGTVPSPQAETGGQVRRVADGSQSGGATRELANSHGGNASAEGLQRGGEQRLIPQDGFPVSLGNPDQKGSQGWRIDRNGADQRPSGATGVDGNVDNPAIEGLAQWSRGTLREGQPRSFAGRSGNAGTWRTCDWLPCTDGKARPVEPGTFPLAHGIPGRVGRLRAYGNAIVPQVAVEFIKAAL